MRVCDFIADYFYQKSLKYYFGFQGGAVTPLIDSMYQKGIRFFQSYHEQAGGFSADAYARISGELSVVMATNGPGATNLVSAVANAYLDSIPVLFITGQVNTTDIRKEGIRQNGFQEVDNVSIMRPITKYATQIQKAEDVLYELEKAIDIATSGRKGAVLVDIPLNILMSEINEGALRQYKKTKTEYKIEKCTFDTVLQMMEKAKRPVVLAGGGVRACNAVDLLEQLSQKTKFPVISTWMGFDVYTSSRYGVSGLYGQTYANLALLNADFVLVLGSRFAKRQIGASFEKYISGATVIQVDIDETELTHNHQPDLAIHGDILDFLKVLLSHDLPTCPSDWTKQLQNWKIKYANDIYVNGIEDPVLFVKNISLNADKHTIVCTDVGQNQMWVMQGWQLKEGQRVLTSGGLGCMGFSVPAAIGAQLADKKASVIAFCGDGGFQMNVQELQTIATNDLPIKIVVFNNNSLGMIQENQDKYMGGRFCGTKEGYTAPDFKKLANAYGLKYVLYDDKKTANFLNHKGACLVEIKLNAPVTHLMKRYDRNDVYEKEKI